MSNLRLVGLILGLLGIALTLLVVRGPRWNRLNFVLALLTSVSLVSVSLRPDVVDFLRDFLSLESSQRGRLIGLLVVSNVGLLWLTFLTRGALEVQKVKFDLLVRAIGLQSLTEAEAQLPERTAIAVIIPAHNESENLEILLPSMPHTVLGKSVVVLVVDDGSTDATAAVAQKYGALVVRNVMNRGQGAALRLGYDVLKKHDVAIGVTMDADCQHRPEDLEPMVQPISEDRLDVVIGSRILGQHERGSSTRLFGIHALTAAINILTGQKLTDCSSGFKAFRMDRLAKVTLHEEQYQAAELLIAARKAGLRIGEVPITIQRRQHGTTKKGTNLRYGFMFLLTILKAWWK